MIIKPDHECICVTALNIMDGLNHHRNWAELQNAWDNAGMGFVEFCGWISRLAEKSEEMLNRRDPQDFPGVYDYEVSAVVGARISAYVKANGELPETNLVVGWFEELADAFFKQGWSQ